MWWKFFVGLIFGFFCGSVAMASLYLTANQQRLTFYRADSDRSLDRFRSLSAEEINRRTLKAAAAIEGQPRRY